MIERLLPGEGTVLCAVSGGADSVYLLYRLLESGASVECAHFNHCLRGAESDRDEAFVRGLCAQLGLKGHFGRGEVAAFAAREGLGTEDAARRLRYAFLEETADETGAAAIATAHTADDNAETMLFNLARGAGLKGLCGIPERRGRIIRPILGLTREEVEALLGSGLGPDTTAMQAIGYKEAAEALRGECSREEAVEKIKRETRRYAKRQLTWLRRREGALRIDWEETPDLASALRDSTAFLLRCGIR